MNLAESMQSICSEHPVPQAEKRCYTVEEIATRLGWLDWCRR
jgi:hypothetical protein